MMEKNHWKEKGPLKDFLIKGWKCIRGVGIGGLLLFTNQWPISVLYLIHFLFKGSNFTLNKLSLFTLVDNC